MLTSAASLFLVAQGVAEARSPWDIALQFGMAGAVLIVVWFFVGYLKTRDDRDEKRDERMAQASEKLGDRLHELSESIARLDSAERRRYPYPPAGQGSQQGGG